MDGNVIKAKNTEIKNCSKQVCTLAKLETRTGLQKEMLSSSKKKISVLQKELKDTCNVTSCYLAFYSFQSIARPIYSLSPPDNIHTFALGILKTTAEALFQGWTNTFKQQIDIYVKNLVRESSSSANGNLPQCPVEKGLMNLTNVTATQWIGFWHLIVVAMRCPKGEK